MLPAVNMGWGWCSRTYGYVSTHMPPTRGRRSIRMIFWSGLRYVLATNSAFMPHRPAPTMHTSQSSGIANLPVAPSELSVGACGRHDMSSALPEFRQPDRSGALPATPVVAHETLTVGDREVAQEHLKGGLHPLVQFGHRGHQFRRHRILPFRLLRRDQPEVQRHLQLVEGEVAVRPLGIAA